MTDKREQMPLRTHDQPAEGGREPVEEALDEDRDGGDPGRSRADRAGIVDQQDAALENMEREG